MIAHFKRRAIMAEARIEVLMRQIEVLKAAKAVVDKKLENKKFSKKTTKKVEKLEDTLA